MRGRYRGQPLIHFFRRSARNEAPAAPAIDFAGVSSESDVVALLRDHARAVAGSDGICVVRRVGDEVVYVGEDAIAPLWTGQTFPLRSCVTGMAMLSGGPIVIPDIATDPRVPLHLYLATFVKSLAVFPIGTGVPVMAVSAYWKTARPAPAEALARLEMAAREAGEALTRIAAMPERRAG